jgi:hypothetical protein
VPIVVHLIYRALLAVTVAIVISVAMFVLASFLLQRRAA